MRSTTTAVAAVSSVLLLTLPGCTFQGMNSLPLPGAVGRGPTATTYYVDIANVGTLEPNSPVLIDDVVDAKQFNRCPQHLSARRIQARRPGAASLLRCGSDRRNLGHRASGSNTLTRSALAVHRGTEHRSPVARPVLVVGIDAPGAGHAALHDMTVTRDFHDALRTSGSDM